MTYRLSTLLVLGLLVLPAAPLALAGDVLPDAADVAEWILTGDDAAQMRAVRALDGAPTSYLAEVVTALHARAGSETLLVDPPPPAVIPEGPSKVLIDLDVFRVPQGTSAALFRPNDSAAAQPMTVQYLEASEASGLRRKLLALDGLEGVQGISLLAEDGVETSFAATEEVEVPSDGGEEEARTLDEGLTLTVLPVISADGKYLTLQLDIVHLAVQRPISVTAPLVAEHPSRTTVRIPDGAALVLSGFSDDGPPHREQIVLLNACVLVEGARTAPELPLPEEIQTFIQVEAKVLEVTDARATTALGSRIPDVQDPWRLLEAREVLELLGPGREGAEGVTVLQAPHLTTYDGQMANVSILSQTSYVRDFEVHEKDGKSILDPVIDTIQDGLVLEVTPSVAADRKGIDLEVLATIAELFRPIAEFQTELRGQKVTFQIPELRVSRTRTSGLVPPGRYVLIGGLGEGDEGRRFVLLRTTLVTAEDLKPR